MRERVWHVGDGGQGFRGSRSVYAGDGMSEVALAGAAATTLTVQFSIIRIAGSNITIPNAP